MNLKRFLIVAPIIVALVLLQSYFWVPTYEAQTTGNPDRVLKFIEASIGDAKILNPVVSSDTASSRIEDLVYEGLLGLDENLDLRPRLATSWEITETAYLLVNERAVFPDGTPVTAEGLEHRLKQAVADGAIPALDGSITSVALVGPEERSESLTLVGEDGRPETVTAAVHIPARLRITLSRVDQDLYAKLLPLIGEHYAQGLDTDQRIDVSPAEKRAELGEQIAGLLPVLEHNPSILFHLRRDVRFHDGHEFTARDVKFTYDAIMNPRNLSPRTADFEPVRRVEIVGPYTVRVVYKRLFSPAIYSWTMGILPEHLLNDEALREEMDSRGLSSAARETFGIRDSRVSRNPVGAGPFKFLEWQSDELIHLTRNEDYWEGPPLFKDFFYRIIPDYVTQEVEFRTGAIDAYTPLPHQIARYKDDDRYQALSSLGFGYTYIGYNNRHPILKDRRVRKALGMAIDVDQIIKYILYDEAERVTGPYPKNTDWYDQSIAPLPYDPQGALRILEELGWKKNADGWLEKDGKIFEFNLVTNHGNPIRKAIMTIVQNDWRKIGVKCNTQLFEWAVFLEDFIYPGKFDAVILAWSMGIDPDLYTLWHSSQSGFKQLNFVGYRNPKADRLIERIRREYNRNTQIDLTHQLHRLIAEDQPYTFLYAMRTTEVLDKKIVMVEKDGKYQKIEPTKGGQIYYYFNRWKKLDHAPDF
jgi:ABC-type transport system substrate-binding protein